MIPLIAGGFVFTALIAFAILLWRYPVPVAIATTVFVVILDSLSIRLVEINLGVTIYQDDVAGLVMIAAAAILAIRNRAFPKDLSGPALGLLGLAAFNFLRGALAFGTRPAGNGVRLLVFLVLPALALSAFGPALRMTFSRASAWLCGAAWVFTALSLGRWLHLIPMAEVLPGDEDFRMIPRVLASDYPMVIGLALIVVIGWQLSGGVRPSGMFKALALGAIVVVSQHRSVWVATAAGLGWMVFCSLRYTSLKRFIQFALAAFALAGVATIIVVASGYTKQVTSMLQENVEETKQDDSTIAWRLSGFDEAINRTFSGGPMEILLGPPAGRDLTDIASFASVHIHSRYIDAIAYYGVSGLLLLLLWLGAIASRIRRLAPDPVMQGKMALAKPILQAVFISELVYFTVYYGSILHGAVLGLLWLATAERRAPQTADRMVRPHASIAADPVYT